MIPSALPQRCARLAASPGFNRIIILAIALTGLLSGIETYPEFRGQGAKAKFIEFLQHAVLAVFVGEIIVKMISYAPRPWHYFRRGWNAFDFAIVALCILPLHAEYVVVLRLLRVLRLFTALHGLQIMLSGLLRGIPSLGYVGLLLLLHFYIYAVIGTFAFGDNDPVRFGSLHTSMLTLFQVLTLEGWNDILATQFHGSDTGYDDAWKALASAQGRESVARPIAAATYFISFILIGTMIMLNLFTGVIIRSMEEAHEEAAEEARQRHRKAGTPKLPAEQMQELSRQLQSIAEQLSHIHVPPPPAAFRRDPPA